ncbi:ATP-dependent helicase HrpB [Tamilnaduibacter salinus]|uniref:ATP-dependent helicase HrpB n=1 Tax=Tamilnaduibacter salinus TaxID=1484056 RepID=A0A2U1CX59_9GAMM|nr:ATP-dependent helicase HrpB [Tamilnaduibacter salinus]PVY76471.1 ATP-dependent helicase HrpB [Tamilnaduibacter salinus]
MLPIDDVLPELLATFEDRTTALLQAPPGAGKTTRVPLALLSAGWRGEGRILMLEPRRLAARSAARFMAHQLGESPGETVGYRTRLDTRVSARTRIEVVTEGILTRLIQSDPALEGYAAVLFDEFHERSLQADLGLALVRESQQALRDDLRLLVMSATLDTEPLAQLLGGAPVITSEGRAFPVDVFYRPAPRQRSLPDHVAATVSDALSEQAGSVLVFLPGAGEIRRVARALDGAVPEDVQVMPLYGSLKAAQQDAAIAPATSGTRKVVLATAIAETSLTIEGIRVVVDAGLSRRARFDPNSGMTRLTTDRLSRSSAEQRRGRAGRVEPGVCYRLWSETEHQGLAGQAPPEIAEADLAALVLELAGWGARSPDDLDWLDPPPEAHWRQARDLLQWLDLVDKDGGVTEAGRQALVLGVHPRLAHMVLRGREWGYPVTAARLAALLGERDPLGPGAGADLEHRLRAMTGEYETRADLKPIRHATARLMRRGDQDIDDRMPVGRLLSQAYPDRVAHRRPGDASRYRLSNGRGARLRDDDPMGRETWLVAAELDGQAREALIYRAAVIDRPTLDEALASHIRTSDEVGWDDRKGTVVARRVTRLGALVLEETSLPTPGPERVAEGLLDAVRQKGLAALPWTDAARQWQARVQTLATVWPDDWPDVGDATLLASLPEWLGPFLAGVGDWQGVQRLNLIDALTSCLPWDGQSALSRLAPERLTIPTGQSVRLDYTGEQSPVLATKLQTVFGWTDTPTIADGRLPVVLHLLSPAGRPLAVTSDLSSFWRQAYPEVRKDMRGRYPKHPWPEDPFTAEPAMGTKKSGR